MELIIAGLKIQSEEEFHRVIEAGFDLPGWYGRNLDALWDVMTGMVERPSKIIWINADLSREKLPHFEQIVSLLCEVEERDKADNMAERFVFEMYP